MRILYVPLYAESEPFRNHKSAQELTTFRNCRHDVIWLSGSSKDITQFDSASRVLTLPIQEKFENIYSKTLMGFKWIIANEEFDYLVRTNTSTYFDTRRMKDSLNHLLDKSSLAAGELGKTPLMSEAPLNHGIFLAGTAIILSREVVEALVRMDDSEWRNLPDDVAISMGISELGINFVHIPRIDLTDYKIFEPGSHYRVKSWESVQDTESRFFELESLLQSPLAFRILNVTRFHLREMVRYTKAFPINKGINSIRWIRQIYRYLRLNTRTWKWIFGLNV